MGRAARNDETQERKKNPNSVEMHVVMHNMVVALENPGVSDSGIDPKDSNGNNSASRSIPFLANSAPNFEVRE